MKVCSQLNVPAALSPGKKHYLRIELETEWTPDFG
jgi:hypothetical protein